MLDQFTELAEEYLEYALENKHHGFSNVNDTLQELHQGVSKAYPCGAGLGLLGVAPSGDIGLCHRFVDSPAGKLRHIDTGIDREAGPVISSAVISAQSTIAIRVGRARYAPAAAITKPMFGTEIHRTRIFIVIGFADGRMYVCGSTERLPRAIQVSRSV